MAYDGRQHSKVFRDEVSYPWKAIAGMVKPLLPMECACGQDRLGVTSVSPFASNHLEKRAEVCFFQEQADAESSVLPGFLLQFVLVQLLAEGVPDGQDFTLLAQN